MSPVPFPVEPIFTLAVVAELLGVSKGYVSKLLWMHSGEFPVRRYKRVGPHPRRLRVLTASEVRLLRSKTDVREVRVVRRPPEPPAAMG